MTLGDVHKLPRLELAVHVQLVLLGGGLTTWKTLEHVC